MNRCPAHWSDNPNPASTKCSAQIQAIKISILLAIILGNLRIFLEYKILRMFFLDSAPKYSPRLNTVLAHLEQSVALVEQSVPDLSGRFKCN